MSRYVFCFVVSYTGTTFEAKILFPLLSIGYFLTKIVDFLQLIEIVVDCNFLKKISLKKARKSG